MAISRTSLVTLAAATLAGCIPHSVPPESYGAARTTAAMPEASDLAATPPREAGRRPLFGAPRSDLARDDTAPGVRAVELPASDGEPAPLGRTPRPAAGAPSAAPASRAARPVTPDAVTVPASTYVVKPGDTLGAIGISTGVGADALIRANRLDPPFAVRAGQRLAVPAGRYHQVRAGESGVAIARAYGVRWSEVATLNDLQPPYLLRSGQRLLLPSSREVASRSVEQRADAFRLNIDDLATGSEPALASDAAPARPSASPRRPVPSTEPVAEPRRFAGRFDWPLTGAIIERFGPSGNGRRNDGINIAATRGDPVRAAADGVVAYAGSAIAIYGGLILLKHGDGWITAYGHAEQILVARGQAVKRGDVIARAGATGSVNRPQLHFEIRNKRTPMDPMRYLPAR